MGKASRDKGYRAERGLVHAHLDIGIHAHRVPLSGASQYDRGDLKIKHSARELVAEVKARASGEGFKTLERWLGEHDLIFLRRDRATPLVVLPWSTYVLLFKGGGDGGGDADERSSEERDPPAA
jgi:Holliday junction resolvase